MSAHFILLHVLDYRMNPVKEGQKKPETRKKLRACCKAGMRNNSGSCESSPVQRTQATPALCKEGSCGRVRVRKLLC